MLGRKGGPSGKALAPLPTHLVLHTALTARAQKAVLLPSTEQHKQLILVPVGVQKQQNAVSLQPQKMSSSPLSALHMYDKRLPCRGCLVQAFGLRPQYCIDDPISDPRGRRMPRGGTHVLRRHASTPHQVQVNYNGHHAPLMHPPAASRVAVPCRVMECIVHRDKLRIFSLTFC